VNKKTTLLFLTIFLSLPVSELVAQTGVIKELNGTVELKLPGTRDFTAAKTGDRIGGDTVISTGFKSGAVIEVGSATITVRPLTNLTLAGIVSSGDSENLDVNLRTGRVRAELNPPAGKKASMTVSSPVATASVRGTKFDFDTRNLYVEKGSVAFRGSRGGLTLVKAGFRGRLDNSNKVYNPVDIMDSGLLPNVPVGSNLPGAETAGIAGTGTGTETLSETPVTGAVIITPVY